MSLVLSVPTAAYKVDLIKVNRAHFYDVTHPDGRKSTLPGVTGFLGVINKPALVPWAKKEALRLVEEALRSRLKGKPSARVNLTDEWIASLLADAKERPDQIKTAAADLGTRCHEFFDLILHGRAPAEVPAEISMPVETFKAWYSSSGIQMVMGDTKVASVKHGYGGSFDALGFKDGKYGIIDFKTSNGIWKEYALQVAAYAVAAEETFGIPIEWGLVARFGKTKPEFEPGWVANMTHSFGLFLDAMGLRNGLEGENELFTPAYAG